MACPFCGREMTRGSIRFGGRASLRWLPEGAEKSLSDRFWDALGGVGTLTAGRCSTRGTGTLPADYCPSCRKMILETDIVT